MKDVGRMIHVGISTNDMERAVRFYEEGFGFHKTVELNFTAYVDGFFGESLDSRELYGVAEGSTCRVALLEPETGDMILEIFDFSDKAEGELSCWNKPGISHFAFESDHFTELYERLKASGANFLMRPGVRVADGLQWVFLRDPDGNMIEILGRDA